MERVGRRHTAPDFMEKLDFGWVRHQRFALIFMVDTLES
jgi:hypothetical protein